MNGPIPTVAQPARYCSEVGWDPGFDSMVAGVWLVDLCKPMGHSVDVEGPIASSLWFARRCSWDAAEPGYLVQVGSPSHRRRNPMQPLRPRSPTLAFPGGLPHPTPGYLPAVPRNPTP